MPHVLTDARVWPPLVLTPPGVSVPVEQLHLLPGFSRIGSDGVTVPYSLLVQGYPPVTLFGSGIGRWQTSVGNAVVQLDRRPSHIHFLTVPLPGLDSPQVLVTEPGQADSGVLLPLDLREVRLEVFPVSVEAGMSIRDILDRAAADQPALHDRLVEPWSQDRVFLQDCKGRVYDVLPPELEDLQWLVLRIRPPGLRAALPPAIPDDPLVSTTTSTTMMRAPGPTASIVIVCDGATVRSAPYPLENVPLRLILIDLLRSLVNLGRLRGPFTLQLAPVMSRAAAADHLIVPSWPGRVSTESKSSWTLGPMHCSCTALRLLKACALGTRSQRHSDRQACVHISTAFLRSSAGDHSAQGIMLSRIAGTSCLLWFATLGQR